MTNAKNLKIAKTTSVITLEHGNTEMSVAEAKEVKAIYALLGGYNAVARHIDVDKFHAIQERFKDAIQELKDLM